MNNESCSKYFFYEDFYYCSDTWKATKVENKPLQKDTKAAISDLATNILDPVVDHFGGIQITYGFCSPQLISQIRKNELPKIAPDIDQHAGYELNNRGSRICKRDGFACDFLIKDQNMREVGRWVSQNCEFDSMYYYGSKNSLHVSFSSENKRQIVIMKQHGNRRMPRVIKAEVF